MMVAERFGQRAALWFIAFTLRVTQIYDFIHFCVDFVAEMVVNINIVKLNGLPNVIK